MERSAGRLAAGALAAGLIASTPPPAGATTIGLDEERLEIAPTRQEAVEVDVAHQGGRLHVTSVVAGIVAGRRCTSVSRRYATCPARGIRSIAVAGSAADDAVDARGVGVRVVMAAGDGIDHVEGGTASDVVDGGPGDDTLVGAADADRLRGGSGDDVLGGGGGDDTLAGGDGADVLAGGATGEDVLIGGAGPDALDGGFGEDHLLGESGDDRLNGGDGRDELLPGPGRDLVLARDRLVDVVDCDFAEDTRDVDAEDVLAPSCQPPPPLLAPVPDVFPASAPAARPAGGAGFITTARVRARLRRPRARRPYVRVYVVTRFPTARPITVTFVDRRGRSLQQRRVRVPTKRWFVPRVAVPRGARDVRGSCCP